MTGPFEPARTLVPLDGDSIVPDDVLDAPSRLPAPSAADAPDPMVVRLRRAGLIGQDENVEVVTDAPPPVRERTPTGGPGQTATGASCSVR